MALTVFEKQNIVISQFERTIRNAKRNPQPTFIEREIAASAKRTAPKRVAEPRISFYNPNNPLNGFKKKTAAVKAEIKEQLKAAAKASK